MVRSFIVKKIISYMVSGILLTSVFNIPMEASKQKTSGDLFNQYSAEYLEQIEYLSHNIVTVDGKYTLNNVDQEIIDTPLFAKMNGIIEMLNNKNIIEIVDNDIYSGHIWVNVQW